MPGLLRPVLLALAVLAGTSSAAAAHEVGVVLVVPREDPATFQGFRLAVDQSPDVSHAPGAAAGDHLGAIDVDVRTVEASNRGTGAGTVARAMSRGAQVLVVAPDPDDDRVTREILSRLSARERLIVVSRAVPVDAPVPMVGLRDLRAAAIERRRLARFERAYARRPGRRPDAAARRGYAAG